MLFPDGQHRTGGNNCEMFEITWQVSTLTLFAIGGGGGMMATLLKRLGEEAETWRLLISIYGASKKVIFWFPMLSGFTIARACQGILEIF